MPDQSAEAISSLVRNASSPNESQGGAISSLVRSPAGEKADAESEAKPLDLQELFAEVNGLGGKIVRQGEGFGVLAGGEFLLLSPTLKTSLNAHAEALELVVPQRKPATASPIAQAQRHDTQEDSDAWLASLDPEARAFFKER